jgi:hypothetical protein
MWHRQGDYLTIVGLNWVAVERLLPKGHMRQAVLDACRYIESGALEGDGERVRILSTKQTSTPSDTGGNA